MRSITDVGCAPHYARSARRALGRTLQSIAVFSILALVGCHSAPVDQPHSASKHVSWLPDAPETVAIAQTTMQSGFSMNAVRQAGSVASFRIAKLPVTWKDYDACVSQGDCPSADPADCPTWSFSPYGITDVPPYATKTERGPAVCVGETGAEAYCKALGGRLPTLNEWLVAARGENPTRFAWGDRAGSCDQHPFSRLLLQRQGLLSADDGDVAAVKATAPLLTAGAQAPSLLPNAKAALDPLGPTALLPGATKAALPIDNQQAVGPAPVACKKRAFDGAELAVGTHPRGASPLGVEDILLAPGELLKTDTTSPVNACSPSFAHCVVSGFEPAAIDQVETFAHIPAVGDQKAHSTIEHAYAFRCAFDAGTEQ